MNLDNRQHENKFLTPEEEHLVEEIKFIQKIMADAENVYSAWERLFLLIMVALMAAIVAIIESNQNSGIINILPLFGIVFSVMFLFIQRGNHLYASARLERWKKLETLLKNKIVKDNCTYMQILSSQDEYLNRPDNSLYKSPFTTWEVRKMYPIVFVIIWVVFLLFI